MMGSGGGADRLRGQSMGGSLGGGDSPAEIWQVGGTGTSMAQREAAQPCMQSLGRVGGPRPLV